MTVRKLSDSDKQEIIERYRSPGETTSTLAVEYGVSNSTISRILKTGLPEADYEALIQQKRGRSSGETTALDLEATESLATPPDRLLIEEPLEPEPIPTEFVAESVTAIAVDNSTTGSEFAADDSTSEQIPLATIGSAMPVRRSRRRSSAPEPQESELLEAALPPVTTEVTSQVMPVTDPAPVTDSVPETQYEVDASVSDAILDEELIPSADDLEADDLEVTDLEADDLEDDDLDDDLEQDLDDDLDEEEGDLDAPFIASPTQGRIMVQVLPLTDAPLPKTCYLVVDRSAELVARPLKEFGELGQISEAETLVKTLPVFDNHRVAKRFSNPRTQRVIKLPDGKVLQKTSSHLQAKGITHLLIDGQVYALQSKVED